MTLRRGTYTGPKFSQIFKQFVTLLTFHVDCDIFNWEKRQFGGGNRIDNKRFEQKIVKYLLASYSRPENERTGVQSSTGPDFCVEMRCGDISIMPKQV